MRSKPWILLLALWTALGVAYSPALWADFVNWDDDRFITANPLFDAGGWSYVQAAFAGVQFEAYQPLHLLSYLPDRYLWPTWPGGFHLINLALLFGLAAVAYRLARRIAGPQSAAMACALVLLHPICVEPVVWITSRKDALSALLFVVALTVDDRRWAAQPPAGGSSAPERSYVGKVWPGLLVFACALLTKTATLCYPLVLTAWLRWIRKKSWRAAIAATLPHLVLAALTSIAVMTLWSSNQLIGQTRPEPVWIDVPASLAVYVRHLVWPVDLAAVYHPEPSYFALGGGLVLALLAGLLVTGRWLPRGARFAGAAFVAALLPVINVVPVYYRYSDRYAFLAWLSCIVPLAMALDWLMTRWPSRAAKVGILAVAMALSLTLAGLTFVQTRVWRDSHSLWANNAEAQPRAYFGRLKYGETLRESRRWSDAAAQYQAAVRLEPDRPLAYAGLFFTYATQAEAAGRVDPGTAERWLRDAGVAMTSLRQSQRFRHQVSTAGCKRCESIWLLLELRRWQHSDDRLEAEAKRALTAGQPERALIYLSEVGDRSRAEYEALWREAVEARSAQ